MTEDWKQLEATSFIFMVLMWLLIRSSIPAFSLITRSQAKESLSRVMWTANTAKKLDGAGRMMKNIERIDNDTVSCYLKILAEIFGKLELSVQGIF